MNDDERMLVKMFANLLESYGQVRVRENRLTIEEYLKVPG